ncbi:MAG: serine hydrolase domain-containing protein [Thermoprotei archaeon]
MLDQNLQELIRSILRRGISEGTFPGAVASLVIGGEEVSVAEGLAQAFPESERRGMELATPFDLASLTKVIVTTTLLMMSVDRGLLDLEDPVHYYVDFDRRVKLVNLANHSSGLPAWLPLYQMSVHDVREAVSIISKVPISEPGKREVYSDLGFLLLGYILESVNGSKIDELAKEKIFKPLGMESTCFSPCPGAAATEVIDGKPLVGSVHDENARALGGKCGHAGLFSTARDLTRFADALLKGRLLSSASVSAMLSKSNVVEGGNHAIGWQVITENRPASAGSLMGQTAFGHTGFTGTSMWIDPEKKITVVLLTNSVHMGRGKDVNRYRRQLGNVAVAYASQASR